MDIQKSSNNPVVLITGGGKGFGKALVRDYLKNNWRVASVTRSEGDFADVIEEYGLNNSKDCAKLRYIDVTDFSKIEEFIHEINCDWGGVDVLINNAGMRFRREFLDIKVEEFQQVMNVNLVSIFHLCQLTLPKMLERSSGKIINISSILGETSLPFLSGYQTSKFALNGLTKSLACEFASQGISVNAIAAGFCKTSYFDNFKANQDLYDMTLSRIPQGSWGEDKDIVSLCRYLSSPEARYINGAVISVDGGWTA